MLRSIATMEPTRQPFAAREASPADVDRAFDEMQPAPSPVDRLKEVVVPKLREARTYLEQHRVAMAAVGFACGYVLGRALRRS